MQLRPNPDATPAQATYNGAVAFALGRALRRATSVRRGRAAARALGFDTGEGDTLGDFCRTPWGTDPMLAAYGVNIYPGVEV